MPRKAALGEHRNDHQMATAKWLNGRTGIVVAWDENEIATCLEKYEEFESSVGIPEFASTELLSNLRRFIEL
jgi:hypothetical protein